MASLARYLIRRAIQGVITLFIVTVIVFILFYFSGNPLDGLRANPSIQQAVIDRLRQQYGLDQGPEVQLYRYVINMFTFNFGYSSYANAPRSEEHTSELQSQSNLVCRLLLEKQKQ